MVKVLLAVTLLGMLTIPGGGEARRANVHLFNYNPYHDCTHSGVGSMHITWWVTGSCSSVDIYKNGFAYLTNQSCIVGDYDLGATISNGDTFTVRMNGIPEDLASDTASVIDESNNPQWCE